MFSKNSEPPVEPADAPSAITIAPPQEVPAVLQSFIVPSVNVAIVSSAKLKHAVLAVVLPSTLKSLIVTTVPCPLPCSKAEATFLKVMWFIVKFPTFALDDGVATVP